MEKMLISENLSNEVLTSRTVVLKFLKPSTTSKNYLALQVPAQWPTLNYSAVDPSIQLQLGTA